MENREFQAYGLIKQHLLPAFDEDTKKVLLLNILNHFAGFKMLVFANTKSKLAEFVYEKRGRTVACLHGDVPPKTRARVFRGK